MLRLRALTVLIPLAAVAACQDMDIENPNEPGSEVVYDEPQGLENLAATAFHRFLFRTEWTSPAFGLGVASNSTTSSWGNFAMQDLGSHPRRAWDNSPTYTYEGTIRWPWEQVYEANSAVTDLMVAVEDEGATFVDSEGQDVTQRNIAWSKFIQGISHGWLALFFDRAYIFDEDVVINELPDVWTADDLPDPVPYTEVMDAAVGYLEEAIDIAENNTFELPTPTGSWVSQRALSNQELAEWAHSFLARYKTAVARTPAERDAVDWDRVVYHLDHGVQADMDGPYGDGWDNWIRGFWDPWYEPLWFRANYDLIGPADESGQYEEWRSTPLGDRQAFWLVTEDRRIHGEETETATDPHDSEQMPEPGKYMRGEEPMNSFQAERGMEHMSAYYPDRWRHLGSTDRDAQQPYFTKEERNLLRAEAYLRDGDVPSAVDLINISRTENGELEPLPRDEISEDEAWKQLTYESTIEMLTTVAGLNFFNRRGWGQLICGTPLHFPMPGAELDRFGLEIYTTGGEGDPDGASEADGCWEIVRDENTVTVR